MKTCLINQPAGLGDIMYTYAIAAMYASQRYTVVWPVIRQYEWIQEYLGSASIQFVSQGSSFVGKQFYDADIYDPVVTDHFVYLPLCHSSRSMAAAGEPLLFGKYVLSGCPELASSWPKFLSIRRNMEREERLSKALCLSSPAVERYIYHNSLIGSPDGNMQTLAHITIPPTSSRVVEHQYMPEFTLFDYIPILSGALEIHTPNTSMCFLVDYLVQNKLALPSQKRYMYARDLVNPINFDFRYLEGCFFDKNWTFVLPS